MDSIKMLQTRQSTALLIEPAPNADELSTILDIGMRSPDHGALTPWHFTVVEQLGLEKLGNIFVDAVADEQFDEAKREKIRNKPFRAPLIIIVSTRFKENTNIPDQEQFLAAGCSVHAMQMAAFSLGYGAMWRTGSLTYNDKVKSSLGIANHDEIVGFLYIGTPKKALPEKVRKPYQDYVSYLR